ncbi:ChbG/HpnK family deacetylase [Bradyrhizobium manausense]|uniref:carbohydrate deacetylase n=1 Tax=Bradyrhizobium manausense TaxID=989370 RepID=UPI001BA6F64A|nr:ChbG/HpnK family deacetylase [Bradyrhizobium manausense]MBR1085963.1 ChbG/HpnK family deacetylase [Bradyrhizobium manausense]
MNIIINADDFGLSDETVAATAECFRAGALTSATIMAKMPGSTSAISFARAHPEFSFGVHLTFAAESESSKETAVADPRLVPTLAHPDGRLRPTPIVRLLALQGRIPIHEIVTEASAQIGLLRDMGVPLSHVDSHGHLHKFAPFRRALATVLPRFEIRKVRGVQDIYLKKPYTSPTYWFGSYWGRDLARRYKTTDHFFMPTSSSEHAGWGPKLLKRLSGNAIEVGVHPGHDEAWRKAEWADTVEFATLAVAGGHRLTTWNDI